MHVISKKVLREFWQEHIEAEEPFRRWFKIADRAKWHNLAEAKADCPSTESVGKCTVFNIGGNKYRLIAKIEYFKQQIYIKFVLTHKEYDTDAWKEDC
jgi:mRNA interferase HigB